MTTGDKDVKMITEEQAILVLMDKYAKSMLKEVRRVLAEDTRCIEMGILDVKLMRQSDVLKVLDAFIEALDKPSTPT